MEAMRGCPSYVIQSLHRISQAEIAKTAAISSTSASGATTKVNVAKESPDAETANGSAAFIDEQTVSYMAVLAL